MGSRFFDQFKIVIEVELVKVRLEIEKGTLVSVVSWIFLVRNNVDYVCFVLNGEVLMVVIVVNIELGFGKFKCFFVDLIVWKVSVHKDDVVRGFVHVLVIIVFFFRIFF